MEKWRIGFEHKVVSALGKLIHDLRCKELKKIYYEELRERTGYFKEEGKGETSMCEAMRDLIQEERMEGMIEGQIRGMKEGRKEGILVLVRTYREEMHLPKEEIIKKISLKFDLSREQAEEYVEQAY